MSSRSTESAGSPLLVVPEFTHPTRIEGARTPSHSISLTPKAFLPETVALSKVFVGVAIGSEKDSKQSVVVVSDGRSVIRSERSSHKSNVTNEYILDELLNKIEQYAQSRGHKIEIIALSPTQFSLSLPAASFSPTPLDRFIDRTWLSLDALPFLASPESATSKFSLDGQAVAAIEEAVNCLEVSQGTTVRIQFDKQRQVLVDANHRVQLHSLSLLKRVTTPSLFSTFELFSQHLIERKSKVAFFSATPRGGGVALMRHSMMRLWQQVGVDASWYVPPGDSNVFNVTKRKFHNILQGVAPPSTILTDQDKDLFTSWAEWYFKTLWKDKDGEGSKFLCSFDVIVIDDPQVLGLIPYIRKFSPRTKIIYRSHIQIRADLIDQGVQQQTTTWDFIWTFIRQVDLFVAHPLAEFVPQIVKDSLPVVYMPPCTAPLDGLNKPISPRCLDFYRRAFDLSAQTALGREVDWSRGYILQIARFDPSKGIPDLVEAFRLFRISFAQDPVLAVRDPPQLVLTGHSSIDDPDAVNVLKALYEQLSDPSFDSIRDDIFAVRAPSSDRLLNSVLEGADVVCQVSIREGYEIKVSEAIHRGQWVIGTKTGGIPLQIRDGVDGRLVEANDPRGISEAILEFYRSRPDRERRSNEVIEDLLSPEQSNHPRVRGEDESERHFTLANSTMWEYLFLRLLAADDISHGAQGEEKMGNFGFKRGVDELNGGKVWELVKEARKEA
ncbi:hypothetical protein JCM3765_003321 [Sporobolomyces pararoseus]